MRFSYIAALTTALVSIGICQADPYDQSLAQRAVYYSLAAFCENQDLGRTVALGIEFGKQQNST